jgi:hypothetical protein
MYRLICPVLLSFCIALANSHLRAQVFSSPRLAPVTIHNGHGSYRQHPFPMVTPEPIPHPQRNHGLIGENGRGVRRFGSAQFHIRHPFPMVTPGR